MRVCREGDEIVLSTAKGTIIRQRVDDLSIQSRTATGVSIQRIDKDDEITMVDIIPAASINQEINIDENENVEVSSE
jgi:DNA gyrase subunit A